MRNGYHILKNVMRVVDLCDCITVSVCESERVSIKVQCDGGLPSGKENVAYKAAEKFLAQTNKTAEISIIIEKHIPSCAGLGGGSADAAAVLNKLNEHFCFPLNREELLELGREIGDDVPFLLVGKLNDTGLYCSGNEKTVRVEIFPKILTEMKAEIAMPSFSISTANAFARYDDISKEITPNPSADLFIEKLRCGRLDFALIYNVFERLLTPEQAAEIESIRSRFIRNGAITARMSGSGSACFGLKCN
jgi:4-diphosphocytidyl-2-C-methyl-D-erythritol kinase